jgi:hypothetical protein
MVPLPLLNTAAADVIRGLMAIMTLDPARTGISEADADTVKSAPNRTKANEVVALVTTTDSPPPAS